jgi:hypothetical protein
LTSDGFILGVINCLSDQLLGISNGKGIFGLIQNPWHFGESVDNKSSSLQIQLPGILFEIF